MLRRAGTVTGVGRDQLMDGGWRGEMRLVPELPIGQYRRHLEWVKAGLGPGGGPTSFSASGLDSSRDEPGAVGVRVQGARAAVDAIGRARHAMRLRAGLGGVRATCPVTPRERGRRE